MAIRIKDLKQNIMDELKKEERQDLKQIKEIQDEFRKVFFKKSKFDDLTKLHLLLEEDRKEFFDKQLKSFNTDNTSGNTSGNTADYKEFTPKTDFIEFNPLPLKLSDLKSKLFEILVKDLCNGELINYEIEMDFPLHLNESYLISYSEEGFYYLHVSNSSIGCFLLELLNSIDKIFKKQKGDKEIRISSELKPSETFIWDVQKRDTKIILRTSR